jgi:hypothetical protein
LILAGSGDFLLLARGRNRLRGSRVAAVPPGGIIWDVSTLENGDGPQPRSPAYDELLGILRDPHRHETARNWEQVVQSELGPEDRAKAEKMAPVVRRYLSKETDRETYERELGSAIVPEP